MSDPASDQTVSERIRKLEVLARVAGLGD